MKTFYLTPLTPSNIYVGMRVRNMNWITPPTATITEIVCINKSVGFKVQWDDSESMRAAFRSEIVYSNWDSWEILEQQNDTIIVEKPCKGCQRMNDVGVKICWCCGNSP